MHDLGVNLISKSDTDVKRAQSLLDSGQKEGALEILDSLKHTDPDNVFVWLLLGQTYGMLDQDAAAELAFRRALELRPEMFETQFNVALSLTYQERLMEAIPFFEMARSLRKDISGLDDIFLKVLQRVLQQESLPLQKIDFDLPTLSENALVSVIVPTKDRLALLNDALVSIYGQTYKNWEVIVINDGGSSIVSGIKQPLKIVSDQVRLIESSTAGGPGSARNKGIALARGDVITFLDDDDLYLPNHLEIVLATLRLSAGGGCYTKSALVIERFAEGLRTEIRRGLALGEFHYSRLLLETRNYIPINTWAVRRECFAKAGYFDQSLACAEDWEMLLRLTAITDFVEIDKVTTEIHMRENASDSVSTRNRLRPACEEIYRKHPSSHRLVKMARELYMASLV